jgi:type IV pilus biogenesis protein CpaD/CtpE
MLKKCILAVAVVAVLAGCTSLPAMTAADDVSAVSAAAEKLRVAMVDPTPGALAALVADDLSYGHSGGRVDTKTSFISDLLEGKSDFVSIVITDQTVKVANNLAIVRHSLAADTNDSGKISKVSLKVLGIWQKQGTTWKLIARQAVRPPQ